LTGIQQGFAEIIPILCARRCFDTFFVVLNCFAKKAEAQQAVGQTASEHVVVWFLFKFSAIFLNCLFKQSVAIIRALGLGH
jgi:hypothetical protein